MTAVDPGPVACLIREFPGWQISIRPAGLSVAAAYWESDDGRHRRYIVAKTAAELLGLLRERSCRERRPVTARLLVLDRNPEDP